MYFDWGEISRWSRLLGEAAEVLDQAAETKPETLDAGPFTSVVMDMVEATVADYVHLVLRLAEASERLRDVAAYYREVEEANEEAIVKVGDPLWSLTNSLDERRRKAWEGSDDEEFTV